VRIDRIVLKGFRSYDFAVASFHPQLNLVTGPNGSGKTNLLEALFLLTTGRSFRTLHLGELIRDGAVALQIEAKIQREEVDQTISLSFDGQHRRLSCNQTTYSTFTPLVGLLPAVLIAPEDVDLVKGAPEKRRRFLDLHLAQTDPTYLHHLSRFTKALRHRNALLKEASVQGIDVWEALLTSSAGYLQEKRQQVLASLATLMNGEGIQLIYDPSPLGQLSESRPRELLAGITLSGPHRDDFTVILRGREARKFASQGEVRRIAGALRLATWDHLFQLHGSPPLLFVDDFGVHLDVEQKRRLLDRVHGRGQVFLSTPEPFAGPHRRFEVTSGQIVEG
jgi:DNA replication and repair protein RecF